jgi:hypothetical protein
MNGVVGSDRFRSRDAASPAAGGSGGGNMDDILKRLGLVESSVTDIRAQVSAITAVTPHLATKADVSSLRADMNSMETSIIKWIIGTTITSAALAFTIAKFVS